VSESLVVHAQVQVGRMLDGLDLVRQRARVCLELVGEAAWNLAQVDLELQAASDVLEQLRLALARRYAAEVHAAAEQKALDAVFALRMVETSIEHAGAFVRRTSQ
jgi:hypothetical protein